MSFWAFTKINSISSQNKKEKQSKNVNQLWVTLIHKVCVMGTWILSKNVKLGLVLILSKYVAYFSLVLTFKWTQLYYKNHNLGGRSTRDLLSGRNFKPLSLSLSRWSTRDLFGGRSFKPLSLSPSPWLPPSHNKKSQFFINWGTSEVKERENILKENIFFTIVL